MTLENIRQIPGVEGIVSALYDIPRRRLAEHRSPICKEQIESAGFEFSVVESIPVHEDIKLGRPASDRWIDHYCQSVAHVGDLGIPVVCYNFMPLFDWMRTDLEMRMADGSTTVAYDHAVVEHMDLSKGMPALTAWVTGYDGATLAPLLLDLPRDGREELWEHLAYFLARVAKVADEAGVKLGASSRRSALEHVRCPAHHHRRRGADQAWCVLWTVPPTASRSAPARLARGRTTICRR